MANYWCVWLMCAWSTFFLIHLDMAHVTSTWQQTCHIHFGRDSTVRRAWKPGFRVLPAHKISWTWILHMFGFFIALDCAHDSLDTRENTMWSITTALLYFKETSPALMMVTSSYYISMTYTWKGLHKLIQSIVSKIYGMLKIKMQMMILRCWWRRQLY